MTAINAKCPPESRLIPYQRRLRYQPASSLETPGPPHSVVKYERIAMVIMVSLIIQLACSVDDNSKGADFAAQASF